MILKSSLNIFNSASPSQNLKRCMDCGEWKDKGQFTGRHARCKACRRAGQKEYYVKNREKKLKYYFNNRGKYTALKKEWRAKNPEKIATYYSNLKAQAYAVLGGAFCARCGYTGTALQIDHVNSDGFLERKKGKSGTTLHKKIIDTGGAGYQVLCANCNWEKREEDEKRRKAMKV